MADFETVSEQFSVYKLPDGSKITVKHVLVKIEQTGINDQGHPQFNMNFVPVCHIEPSKPIGLQLYEGLTQFALNAGNNSKKGLQ